MKLGSEPVLCSVCVQRIIIWNAESSTSGLLTQLERSGDSNHSDGDGAGYALPTNTRPLRPTISAMPRKSGPWKRNSLYARATSKPTGVTGGGGSAGGGLGSELVS